MTSYTYSEHAVQRMIERKIDHELVLKIITTPDGTIKQSKDKIISFKKIQKRKDNLIAVVSVKKEILTVINFSQVKI